MNSTIPARQPSSWVWLLSLFTAASFIEVIFWGQIGAFTPLYLPHLGIAPSDVAGWTGLVTAVSAFVGIPLLPFWGALADRYARQPVIVRSFVVHIIAGLLAMLAGNIWVFVLGRAIQSFALGNSGLMMTTLSERTPRARIGLAFSVLNGSAPLGAFIGPLIGGPIVDRWGFPVLMGINVVLMTGVVLATTFGYKDTFKGTDRGPILRMAVGSVGIVTRSARLRVLFPALFLLFSGWMMALTYLPLAVKALYHGTTPGTAVGWVLGAGGLVTLVLSPALGALADKWGHWRMLLLGAGLMVLLWPLPALTGDLFAFGATWAVISGLSSAVFAISFSVLSDSIPQDQRGRVMSFSYLPVNLGNGLGAAIGGLVTQVSLFAVFPAAAALTALGVAALLLARRQPSGVAQMQPG